MKEHPILFSTDMVKAKLAGNKTMTRRLINPQPIIDDQSGFVFDGKHRKQYDIHNWKDRFIDDWSRWMPGDLLWTRESWSYYTDDVGNDIPGLYQFKTDSHITDEVKFRPSIHMPKDACRIWDEIISIKIERVADITEDDAKKEGANRGIFREGPNTEKGEFHLEHNIHGSYKAGFEFIWKIINGKDSWKLNQWVWVIEYKNVSLNGPKP